MLKYKRQAEQLLEASGLPYVLLRPGRLTDGPYTSYDLNTLLQATAGSRQDVQLSAAETQNGEASRIAVAGLLIAHASLVLWLFDPAVLATSTLGIQASERQCLTTNCRAHHLHVLQRPCYSCCRPRMWRAGSFRWSARKGMARARMQMHGGGCSHQLIHDRQFNCIWQCLVLTVVSGQELLQLAMVCFFTAWKLSNKHRQARQHDKPESDPMRTKYCLDDTVGLPLPT